MDKRDFLKASGALLAGSLASQLQGGSEKPRTNWSGNYQYRAKHLFQPGDAAEACKIIQQCEKLRPLGARHSFNGIADSTENQISIERFNAIEVDAAKRVAKVGAGVKYGQLAPVIDKQGFAVHNLASLPHISVVGACATATHGSGVKNGNLSTAVCGLELLNAAGEHVQLTSEKDGDRFGGAVVGLGAMGVVTSITLKLQPSFRAKQFVFENLPFSELKSNLETIFSAGYSVSLFTDWQHGRATQVWIKQKENDSNKPGAEFFGAKAATRKLHPLAGHPAESCTEQLGEVGPWYERLPHFRMNFTPSSGAELQTEYFVPRAQGYEAICAVEKLRNRITPRLFITELRAIAADELWMSPCYQRDALAIHFTWKPEWPAVKQVLPSIEAALAPFDARPHWAKLFTMKPERLRSQYPKLQDWKDLAKTFDPQGKFRNEFLNEALYA